MATKKKRSKGRRPSPSKARSQPRAARQGGAQSPATKAASESREAPPSGDLGTSSTKQSTKAPPPAPPRPRERTTPTRAERLEAARRARRRRAILTRMAIVGTVVVLVGIVAFVVVNNRQSSANTVKKLEAGSCEFDQKADRDEGPGRNHVTGGSPAYNTNPPSGGNHLPQDSPPGVYTEQQLPPDGQLVHSLEHGYVIVWHRPDLAQEDLTKLQSFAGEHPDEVLLVPRASLPKPVAVTAWHRRLLCDQIEPGVLSTFVDNFYNKAPEKDPRQQ